MPFTETTPAVKLRQQTVSRIILALIVLTFAELGIIGTLIFLHRDIPGELWQSFSASGAALIALLVNTKVDTPPPGGPGGPPLVVEGSPGGEPVVTDPQGPLDVVPVDQNDMPVEDPIAPAKRKR